MQLLVHVVGYDQLTGSSLRNLKWIYQELSRNVKEWWNDVGPICGCNGVMTVAYRLMKEELKSFKTLIFLMEL